MEQQQPNSGIILIGDSKEWSSNNDIEVQLPGGRKAKTAKPWNSGWQCALLRRLI